MSSQGHGIAQQQQQHQQEQQQDQQEQQQQQQQQHHQEQQQRRQQHQQQLMFGDEATADVVLTLVLPDKSARPLYAHSQVLRRSEYFEARLSERWPHQPDCGGREQLCVENCRNPAAYARCVELLYTLPLAPPKQGGGAAAANFGGAAGGCGGAAAASFSDVGEALAVLEVAAEMLFEEGVAACLRYVEAVPWAAEGEEAAVRGAVAALQLRPPPDLAARLWGWRRPAAAAEITAGLAAAGIADAGEEEARAPAEVMGEVVAELLALISNGAPPKARDVAERLLAANATAFADVNEAALLRELQANLRLLKVQLSKFVNFFGWNSHEVNVASSALRWLLEELFALRMAEVAVRVVAAEEELATLMVARIYQNPFTETLFAMLVRLLEALQRGEVLVGRQVRLSLVRTWLPVVARLVHDAEESLGGKDSSSELQRRLEAGMAALVATLPLCDQEQVFKLWISSCLKSRKAFPDLSHAFDAWCSKLRLAQLAQLAQSTAATSQPSLSQMQQD